MRRAERIESTGRVEYVVGDGLVKRVFVSKCEECPFDGLCGGDDIPHDCILRKQPILVALKVEVFDA
jgi:hypothetical protein